MSNKEATDIAVLAQALEALTRTTQTMEEAYRRLQERVSALDRELADKNRALAFTSDYLDNLLDSMSDGVIAVDEHGAVTRFNRAAAGILGFSSEEVVGRSFQEVFERGFQAPAPPADSALRARSGRAVPTDERDSLVADRQGRPMGKVKAFQDLTELQALREQVRQIDRLAAIGEMAATVAHEIRNPLGGIRGFAAFLAQDIPPEDDKRRLVDKIEEGAKSLEKVVNELLEYTRPVDLQRRHVPCAEVLRGALGYLEYDREAVMLSEKQMDETAIAADPDKMRQVFLNILLNAVQSIRGRGEVSIAMETSETHVTIWVGDTGCGMSAEQMEKLTSPFFTTKEKGTGLGMAVTQKIVEAHGGSLLVESEEGRGTRVGVRLPRAE